MTCEFCEDMEMDMGFNCPCECHNKEEGTGVDAILTKSDS